MQQNSVRHISIPSRLQPQFLGCDGIQKSTNHDRCLEQWSLPYDFDVGKTMAIKEVTELRAHLFIQSRDLGSCFSEGLFPAITATISG